MSNPGASTAKGGPRQNVDVTSLPMWRGEKVSETRNSERERIGGGKNESTMRKRCVTKPIASIFSHTKVEVPNSRSQFDPQFAHDRVGDVNQMSKSLKFLSEFVLGDFRNHHFFHQLLDGFCFSQEKAGYF